MIFFCSCLISWAEEWEGDFLRVKRCSAFVSVRSFNMGQLGAGTARHGGHTDPLSEQDTVPDLSELGGG